MKGVIKMNKYYLYKKVLASPACTAKLETTEKTLFGETTITLMEAYKNRAESINQLIRTVFVEGLSNINGEQIQSLLAQAYNIEQSLYNMRYAEILMQNGHSFQEVLEGLFDLTLENIQNYDKAANMLTEKRIVTVILDGNKTFLHKDSKEVMVKTEIENNTVTIEKCRELIKKLNAENCYPKELTFLLSVYTETANNEMGDYPEECLLKREVNYYVDSDCLEIRE
jgi:hypothetical protein